MRKIDLADYFEKAIQLLPDESTAKQRAVALALRAEYLRGRADEALDNLDQLEES